MEKAQAIQQMTTSSRVLLGIGGLLGHDGNAALLVDGKLIAASQEERFTRKKHDAAFPRASIKDCLTIAGLAPEDVSACVFDAKPLQSFLFDRVGKPTNWLTWQLGNLVSGNRFGYMVEARRLMPGADFRYAWHHLSHAAAAFATSPFERAVFLCVDGKGEDVSATVGVADAHGTEILYELPYDNGVGLLYTLVTRLLGFPSFGSEYKVMGLAPYGEPVFAGKLRAFAGSDRDGGLRLNQPVTFQWSAMQAAVTSLGKHVGLAPREKGDPLTDGYVNMAASIQALFEDEILKMAHFARRVTGEKHLLFCGGCAQNCVAAGKLRSSGLFDAVFNSPVGGDMGTGLGAALLCRQKLGAASDGKVDSAGFYLGSAPGRPPAEALEFSIPYDGGVHEAAARLLAQGKVVGWVRGRMELGARALGARSILADPRVPDMQSVLNLKVKFRESFRPFAPAVLAEECGQWFDTTENSDFMQYTAFLRPEHRLSVPGQLRGLRERLDFKRCDVPSVVHVDYSARIQTVRREVHPDFHQLLSEFRKLTGIPLLINTSFNVTGQPIVRTAEEAWHCFRHTDMDYLVINDLICRNPNDKSLEEKLSWLKEFENSA
jgi:carbamoyltransferase